MLSDSIDLIKTLSADEIAARLDAMEEEERCLRVLLRSARARERVRREQACRDRVEGRRDE